MSRCSRTDGYIEVTIEALKQIISSDVDNGYAELLLIENQYKNSRKEDLRGIVNHEQRTLVHNQISERLITFIMTLIKGDEIQNEFHENLQPYQPVLHYEKSQVVRKMFELIIRLEFAIDGYLNFGNDEKEVVEFHNKSLEFFRINELLFNEETSKIIRDIIQAFKEAWVDYSISLKNYGDWKSLDKELRKDRASFIQRARDVVRHKVLELKKELTESFRAILNVK